MAKWPGSAELPVHSKGREELLVPLRPGDSVWAHPEDPLGSAPCEFPGALRAQGGRADWEWGAAVVSPSRLWFPDPAAKRTPEFAQAVSVHVGMCLNNEDPEDKESSLLKLTQPVQVPSHVPGSERQSAPEPRTLGSWAEPQRTNVSSPWRPGHMAGIAGVDDGQEIESRAGRWDQHSWRGMRLGGSTDLDLGMHTDNMDYPDGRVGVLGEQTGWHPPSWS